MLKVWGVPAGLGPAVGQSWSGFPGLRSNIKHCPVRATTAIFPSSLTDRSEGRWIAPSGNCNSQITLPSARNAVIREDLEQMAKKLPRLSKQTPAAWMKFPLSSLCWKSFVNRKEFLKIRGKRGISVYVYKGIDERCNCELVMILSQPVYFQSLRVFLYFENIQNLLLVSKELVSCLFSWNEEFLKYS